MNLKGAVLTRRQVESTRLPESQNAVVLGCKIVRLCWTLSSLPKYVLHSYLSLHSRQVYLFQHIPSTRDLKISRRNCDGYTSCWY